MKYILRKAAHIIIRYNLEQEKVKIHRSFVLVIVIVIVLTFIIVCNLF